MRIDDALERAVRFGSEASSAVRKENLPQPRICVVAPLGNHLMRLCRIIRHLGSEISRTGNKHALPLFELARVLVRFDSVALTDLTHFRSFPRNLEPDFTHYLCEQRKEMEIYERSRQHKHSHNVSASSSLAWAGRSFGDGGMASRHGVPNQQSKIDCA